MNSASVEAHTATDGEFAGHDLAQQPLVPEFREPVPPPVDASPRLWTGSFVGLLTAQALGSMNDNIFRWLVIGLAKREYPQIQSTLVALGSMALILPYILLAAPAGFFADRFPKQRVIVAAKFAEILLMALGVMAIGMGSIPAIFGVLALLGVQSALYSPSRAGSIPELLHPELISRANGWFGLTNLMSIIIGTVVGNVLADSFQTRGTSALWIVGMTVLGVAAAGWVASLLIQRRPAGNPTAKLAWNFLSSTLHELKLLYQQPGLWRVALGIMFFWSLASLATVNIDQLVHEAGGTTQSQNNVFLAALSIGVGIGTLLAGYWSGKRVELGILPLGALGVIVSCLGLYFCQGEFYEYVEGIPVHGAGYFVGGLLLFTLGASAGMFSLPLEAYLQTNSPRETRGSILAASNFLTFSGMILASGLFVLLRRPIVVSKLPPYTVPWFSAQEIFLACGIATMPVLGYILWLIPQACLRFVIWLLVKCIYRLRAFNVERIPAEGPALLASNHVSFIDAVLIVLSSPRPVRMFAWAGNFENAIMRKLANQWGVILVTSNPKSIKRALDTAHQALLSGEVVCIFPEGAITRGGNVGAFKPGMLKILEGTNAPVIPVYLDQLWGSIFSYEGGKFFWKWPRRWRYPANVHFGEPLPAHSNIATIRNAVLRLSSESVKLRMKGRKNLAYDAIVGMRRRGGLSKFADSTGADLNGSTSLLRTLALRRVLHRELKPDEKQVGVLLPPTVPAIVTNLALTMDHRVVTNLNYTCTAEILDSCLEQAEVKTVFTSQKFLDKLELKLNARMVLLEELRDKVSKLDKFVAAFQTFCLPSRVLGWWLGLTKTTGDELLTLIFTSGSTGKPKGVMLTHGNVASNVEAIDQVIHLSKDDVLLGILPLFHALGSTVTLWAGAILDLKVAYHFSPLDPKQVGKLAKEHGATVLLTTPTFLRSYTRRCEVEEFAKLKTVITGAERLPEDVAVAYEEKFGVRPVEGYGTTELSPLAAVNIPPTRAPRGFPANCKAGTVGQPVPGVCAKVIDPDTGEELGPNQPGLLWIGGPNVMRGYWKREDLTAPVLKDGWYCTGDMAKLDDEGYITITGRLSRFSKIGGEMVPHGAVEEALLQQLGAGDAEKIPLAVTAVPDEKKGERLVVLHAEINKTPSELVKKLGEAGFPNLFIPGTDSFFKVEEIPVLGTGKLDLAAIKKLAAELTAKSTSS